MDSEAAGIIYVHPQDHETIATIERFNMCPVCHGTLGETNGATGTMYFCAGGYLSGKVIEGCRRRYWIDEDLDR